MPNLDPWVNKNNSNKNEDHTVTNTITNKLENHLLSIKAETQTMIHPNSHLRQWRNIKHQPIHKI